MIKHSVNSLVWASVIGAALLGVRPAAAATYYWDNLAGAGFGTAGGIWSSGGNTGIPGWSTDSTAAADPSGSITTTTGDALNFGSGTAGLAAGTVTISGAVSSSNITFGSASGAITLSGGTSITLPAAATITVNNAADTNSTPLIGTGSSLTKSGSGTLTLTGVNTYSGNTTVNNGTLTISGSGNLNSTVTTTVASGAQLFLGSQSSDMLNITGASWSIAGIVNRITAWTWQQLPPNVTLNNGTLTGIQTAPYGTFCFNSSVKITANGSGNFLSAADIGMGSGATLNLSTPLATDALSVSSVLGAGTSYMKGMLTKSGLGTVTLTGASIYTNTTTVSGGKLDLGGSTANGSLASTALTLGGCTFAYTRTGNTTQSFTNTTVTGASAVSAVSGNVMNLGTVTVGAGGAIDFLSQGGGIVAADTASNVGGIIPRATFGSGNFAVSNGAGNPITGFAGTYTLTSLAGQTAANYAGNNIGVDNSAGLLSGVITPNSLRFNTAAPTTVTLATGTSSIGSGSILVTSAVGANLSTITGGTLTGPVSGDLSVIQNNASGDLLIGSVIGNNTATSLTKSGEGTLILTNANTFAGALTVNGGTLKASGGGGAGTLGGAGTITLNGGTTLWLAEDTSSQFTFTRQNVVAAGDIKIVTDKNTLSTGVLYNFGTLALGNHKLTIEMGPNVSNTNTVAYGTGLMFNGFTFNDSSTFDVGIGNVLLLWHTTFASTITLQGAGRTDLIAPYASTGTININGGTLWSSDASIANGAKLTLASGARLDLQTANSTGLNMLSTAGGGGGSGVVAGSFLRYTTAQTAGNNSPGTIFGTVELNITGANPNYTLDFGAGSTLTTLGSYTFTPTSPATGITLSGNASIDASSGTFTGTGMTASSSNSSTNTLTLTGSNTGSNTISSVIGDGSGKIALQKTGTGTWTLSGTNTYSGATTISNGTLKLAATGSFSNSPTINVASGAVFDVSAYTSGYTVPNSQILTGSGLVTGLVTVASGAGISGGGTNDIGTLTCASNLTLNAGAKVYWNYSATTADVVNVNGTLTLPATATVNVSGTGVLPSRGLLFSSAKPLSGATDLSGWTFTGPGANPTTRAVKSGNQVYLVTSSGMVIILQ